VADRSTTLSAFPIRPEVNVAARGFRDLRVFQLSYEKAMELFEISKSFPKDERFALVDQIRRSSRSVCANIAEAYRKRRYAAMLVSKLCDSDAEAAETQVWLDFARDCGYLDPVRHERLIAAYEEIGRMLGGMIDHPEKFTPTSRSTR
jgi:four helix bundle protein